MEQGETMFHAVNHFGIRLLASIAAQQSEAQFTLAPPALYLPLTMLKSVATGATRQGLSRALGTDEKLSEDERERRMRLLRGVVSTSPVTFEASLLSRGHRPFSPVFMRRAQETYGVPLVTDEGNLPLRLLLRLSATVNLTGAVHHLRDGKVLGYRLPADNGLALTVLVPARAAFWQAKSRPLLELLQGLDPDTLGIWRERLNATEPSATPIPPLPEISENIDLLTRLKALDLGPALTPAADFSLMMVASEAPYLAGMRQSLQVQLSGGKMLPTRAADPMVWWLEHEPSGVMLALGYGGGAMRD